LAHIKSFRCSVGPKPSPLSTQTPFCIALNPVAAFPKSISNVIPSTEQVNTLLHVAHINRHQTFCTSECFVIPPVVFAEGQAGIIGQSSELKP
jgi:hypothetical protein